MTAKQQHNCKILNNAWCNQWISRHYHLAIIAGGGVINCGLDAIFRVSPGGLAVKHPSLGANGCRFEPTKRSKLFQRLISRLTTSWVPDHDKWRWIIWNKGGPKIPPENVKHSGSDHPQGISAPSFHTAPLSVVGEGVPQPLQHRGCAD